MFLTDDEAPQAGPNAKRQRVAPVQRKPAAKPEASDEANEFKTDDEPEGNERRSSEVRKKPAAKLTAEASDDAEGNEFQTTDEEPLATAAPSSKAKPKPTGATKKTSITSCQASTAEEPGSDNEFHTEDDSPAKPPSKRMRICGRRGYKEGKMIHADKPPRSQRHAHLCPLARSLQAKRD